MSAATRPSVRDTATRVRNSALCFVGWLIAAIAWIIGARFTIDGILVATNWILAFVSAPYLIAPATWLAYLTLAPLPLWFSWIEWGDNPLQLAQRDGVTLRFLASVCVWLLVVGADAGSTLIGLGSRDAGSSTVLGFFVESVIGLALATAFLTFWPEWLARMMAARWRDIWS